MNSATRRWRADDDEAPCGSSVRPATSPDHLAAVAHLFGVDPPPVAGARILEIASAADLLPSAADLAVLGQFDFVICHGVYSGVPARMRDAILATIRTALAPQGVAYVSYHVQPGWEFGEARHDSSITPCYFVDFVEHLDTYDLVYLADARAETMYAADHHEDTAQELIDGCQSQLELEQCLDFVRHRTFRQSLLVHAHRAARIRYDIGPDRFPALHFASSLPVADGFTRFDHTTQHYGAAGTQQIYTNDHGVKAAIDVLSARWPHTVAWPELTASTRDRLAAAGLEVPADLQTRIDTLLQMLLVRGLVRYRLNSVAPIGDPITPGVFTR
ncbi:methyltransferase regulatory domain-containing protein [Mycolicibacterium fluoranthenivorans]|uniref:SAM-dependent methyltransferase n=1 Tax=Mycolicibacterium fluoranthenivorans TaxID=258505 RepID=A0A7X5ZEL7_9MYCO|nr:methyltransferase regulatory domain-containing protein [Mycolicibacterium fluoranthenivorans]MCV7354061.1 methyltransferase regulatory domain-containing protein [Mycolicibacterium fluoranthenivorans]NIH97379.1 SAM-dependent methyltransferase [Mycolicibacterium fluoranthenivorans]